LNSQQRASKILKLRDLYTRPEFFVNSPHAQHAFTDMHAFRIDFTVSWISLSWARRLTIVVVAASSVLGFVLSLIALLIR
jgi:hypothetical protein